MKESGRNPHRRVWSRGLELGPAGSVTAQGSQTQPDRAGARFGSIRNRLPVTERGAAIGPEPPAARPIASIAAVTAVQI